MVWPPACGDKARWFGDGDSRVLSVCVGVPRSVTHDAMVFLFLSTSASSSLSVIKNHPRRSPADEAGLRLNVRFGGEVSAFLSEMVEGVTGVCRFMSDYAAAARGYALHSGLDGTSLLLLALSTVAMAPFASARHVKCARTGPLPHGLWACSRAGSPCTSLVPGRYLRIFRDGQRAAGDPSRRWKMVPFVW